jgi:predicted nucleic acid-binding protein
VKVYLDAGVFIDYLIARGHTGSYLRVTERRGRPPARLLADAEACFSAILDRHEAITSSLTCYEVEEALYGELRRPAAGIPNADRFIIPAARAVITQTLVTIELFGITLIDLTSAVVTAQCSNLELQKRGIRAADALHITTALIHSAAMFITTDAALIALDGVFAGAGGLRLRCVDTDEALALLA